MPEAVESAGLRAVWSVGELVSAVAGLVQSAFAVCRIRGEVSGFSRAASGHCYFNLKDPGQGAMLRCAMFRRAAQLAGFQAQDGDEVELSGRLAVYEPRGELQFIVESIRSNGAGALFERFIELKSKLEREGLFAAAVKKRMPAYPESVGIVTSLGGAALHDVTTTLARRAPHVRVVVYHSAVQGPAAPPALCEAVATAAARNEVDVLLVCRGGGSLEDLWAFNDESVVRAVRSLPMPVVSGVGHETDVTLVDFAADLRAATPTAAAELVAPPTASTRAVLDDLCAALGRRLFDAIERAGQRLDRAAHRLAGPGEAVRRRAATLDALSHRLANAATRQLDARQNHVAARACALAFVMSIRRAHQAARLEAAALRLDAVDPLRVLSRGYALLTGPRGRPIVSISDALPGDAVIATLRDGRFLMHVSHVENGPAEA